MSADVSYDTYIGFDSAWTDNPKAPGAICAVVLRSGHLFEFHQPRLASFAQALAFIRDVQSPSGITLVALDQPTIVPNATSLRPVERAAASLVSWLGGGVQPSNRGRAGMFCDAAPVWQFLRDLDAQEAPEKARTASSGLFLTEVFPAISMPSLMPEFYGRRAAPRYNPSRRKTFKQRDWVRVASAAASKFESYGLVEPAEWCRKAAALQSPKKADQDQLDAMLCLLVGMHWRLQERMHSMLLGDLNAGYMVLPATPEVRKRLEDAAARLGIHAS